MKKISSILMIVLILIELCSCKKNMLFKKEDLIGKWTGKTTYSQSPISGTQYRIEMTFRADDTVVVYEELTLVPNNTFYFNCIYNISNDSVIIDGQHVSGYYRVFKMKVLDNKQNMQGVWHIPNTTGFLGNANLSKH